MRHRWTDAPRHLCWILISVSVAGCATLGSQGQALIPTRYQTRTGPFIVFTSTPTAPDAPAIRCLRALESDVATTLGMRVKTEEPAVEVYVLNDRESFNHFLRFYYPELPSRRAFFLAQGSRRVVYAFQSDRLEEDLRHEATHALLHVAVGDLPLWLDEGLAEYFEVPSSRHGLNDEHLARLPEDVSLGWTPDLAKLESLTTVREVTMRDYREAWAWVHFMLNGSSANKAILLATFADLRASPTQAKPLSQRLAAGEKPAGALMLAHVEKLRTQPVAVSPAASASVSTVRLQEPSQDAPVEKRGFFDRVRVWLGW